MKYRLYFKKNLQNQITEEIQVVDDDGNIEPVNSKCCNSSDAHRPLCLQLLNSFIADDFEFNQKGYSGLHYLLFAEFIQQPTSKQYAEKVYALKETLINKGQRDRLPRKCKDLVEQFDIEATITRWINSDKWKQLIARNQLEKVSLLSELMVSSSHFSKAVRRYFSMLTAERYRDDSISQIYGLGEISGQLGALWAFSKNYFLNGRLVGSRFTRMAEIFFSRYMEIDVNDLRIDPEIDEIDRWARILADNKFEYPALDKTANCTLLDPYAAQMYYWTERKKDKLSAARTLQLCCNYYKEKLGLNFWSRSAQEALKKINILLPPNAAYDGSSALKGNDPYRIGYGDISWVSSLVDELDILTRKSEAEDYFECDNFVTLCALSLYCLVKHNLPISVCSSCGRYYVPRQDRSDPTNYCFYPSPKNQNYSCSEYHSNFECSRPVTESRKPVKQKINSVRTTISNIDSRAPLISLLNEADIMRFIDFARGGLTVIDKHSKESDEAGENLEHYLDEIKAIQDFLNFFKKKTLRGTALTERVRKIDRIFEELDKCFIVNDDGSWLFNAEYETWKRIMTNIKHIMIAELGILGRDTMER